MAADITSVEVDWTQEVGVKCHDGPDNGSIVEVLRTGINSKHYPVACLITRPDGSQYVAHVKNNGEVAGRGLVIVNKPKQPEKFFFKRWAIVYRQTDNILKCTLYDSQQVALGWVRGTNGIVIPIDIAGEFPAAKPAK